MRSPTGSLTLFEPGAPISALRDGSAMPKLMGSASISCRVTPAFYNTALGPAIPGGPGSTQLVGVRSYIRRDVPRYHISCILRDRFHIRQRGYVQGVVSRWTYGINKFRLVRRLKTSETLRVSNLNKAATYSEAVEVAFVY